MLSEDHDKTRPVTFVTHKRFAVLKMGKGDSFAVLKTGKGDMGSAQPL